MQANNKGDTSQVLQDAEKQGLWTGMFIYKFGVKPLRKIVSRFNKFIYHYFIEGIRAVKKDGQTKEIEKIPNLSYEETVKVMEKCQEDGIRVVAAERGLSSENKEFCKNKSLYQQQKITQNARKLTRFNDFKEKYPTLSKNLNIDNRIKKLNEKQKNIIEKNKDRRFNIYFNKSKVAYMGERIADVIQTRTGVSNKLIERDKYSEMEMAVKEGVNFNSQKLDQLSDNIELTEIGSVDVGDFKEDYCIPNNGNINIYNCICINGI
jgi:hypothetical protein